MRPLNLILVVHGHAHAGEAASEVEALCSELEGALRLLQAHETLRLALALSRRIAEGLSAEGRAILAELVAAHRVELLAVAWDGALFESLPSRDGLSQVQRSLLWAKGFDAKVRGCWLWDDTWDVAGPRVLSRAGLHYTFLDEGFFGGGSTRIDTWAVTERDGAALGLIPVDRRATCFLPWADPRALAHDLQARARTGATTVAAGLSLWDVVGRRGFLEPRGWGQRLIRTLSAQASWLKTVLPNTLVKRARPMGRLYPLTGTAPWLGVDALPPKMAATYARLHKAIDEVADPVLVEASPWMLGPPWSAFLARHDEANRLHKRGLRVSVALHHARRDPRLAKDPAAGQTVAEAEDLLSQAQGALPLYSGVDGGLYRPEVRHAAWHLLARAERQLRAAVGRSEALDVETVDHDCDGQQEVVVSTPHLGVVIRPAAGGAASELVLWSVGNLANTLSRRPELWHRDISKASVMPILVDAAPPVALDEEEATVEIEQLEDEEDEDTPGTPAPSLPRRPPLLARERGLDRHLATDLHRRAVLQAHVFGEPLSLDNLRRGQFPEIGDFLDAPMQLQSAQDVDGKAVVSMARDGSLRPPGGGVRLLRVTKTWSIESGRPVVACRHDVANRTHEPVRARFGVELNLNLDGRTGDGRFLVVQGRDRVFLHDSADVAGVDVAQWVLTDVPLQIAIHVEPTARLLTFPIMSPIRTRTGYGSACQGTALVFVWDLELWGQEKKHFDVVLQIQG